MSAPAEIEQQRVPEQTSTFVGQDILLSDRFPRVSALRWDR